MAERLAVERQERAWNPNTPYDPDADIVGALGEVAAIEAYGFGYDKLTSDGGTSDPGWDLCFGMWLARDVCEGTTVDVKANKSDSQKWVVKDRTLEKPFDWFLFCYVNLKTHVVTFQGRATREQVAALPKRDELERRGKKRWVRLTDVIQGFHLEDFGG